MFSSILILVFAPWLDTSRVRSTKYRPIYKWFFWLFIISVVALGYLGSKPPEGAYVFWARIFTAYYFLHFLVIMPIVGVIETPSTAAALDHRVGAGQGRSADAGQGGRSAGNGASAGEAHDDRRCRAKTRCARRCCWPLALAAPPGRLGRRRGRAHRPRRSGPSAACSAISTTRQLQRGFKVYTEVCARCHGVQAAALPQPGRAGRPGLPRGRHQVAGRHLPGRRRARRAGQDQASARRSRPTPFRRPTRTSRRPASPRTARCRPISR